MGARVTPKQQAQNRQALRRSVPVDYEGMDPEMAATLRQEGGRVLKQKATYGGPGALNPKPAVKKPRRKLGFFGL